MSDWRGRFLGDDEPTDQRKRKPAVDTELDITPMIDVTFLLLIFFLVASTPNAQTAVELAPARHGDGVSEQSSVIVTIARNESGDYATADVYLAGRRQPSRWVKTAPSSWWALYMAVSLTGCLVCICYETSLNHYLSS